MDEKSTGIDFDRQVFVNPQAPETRQASPVGGLLFALAIILIVAFLAYKFIPRSIENMRTAIPPDWLNSTDD